MNVDAAQCWTHETRPGGDGPWRDEPDKIQWIDETTGLDCLMHRNPMGAWCGYVGVPPGHPWHGAGYDDVDVTVHGGLTYAAPCQENAPEGHGVCHVPEPGRPAGVWWLGFDCAHGGVDFMPTMARLDPVVQKGLAMPGWPAPEYRDVAYVTRQCELLAVQVAAAANK